MTTLQNPWLPAAVVILVAGLLSACSPSVAPQDESGDDPGTDGVSAGEMLFDENCAPCHGAEGRGPSLQTLKSLSPEDLRSAIANHPTAGQIPNRLPAAEISDLIEFLED